jgi:hypothetical protein
MAKRIGLWAFAGLAVAVVWAFIAATVGPRYDFNHSTLLALTIPFSSISRGWDVPMTYYEVIALNAAAYALVGLALEPIFRLNSLKRKHL